MTYGNYTRRLSSTDLHVDGSTQPGWVSGVDRLPTAGEQVYCTQGLAEVVKVLGKTSNGSRLLELKLAVPGSKPFFAAADNVLVAPAEMAGD
jgi:hypothetical protein